jgi:nucleotide-binding universal stress UspA family protein
MNPVRTIAVGFDGSPDAQAATRWAFALAEQLDASVVLVHAIGLLEHVKNASRAVDLEELAHRLTVETGMNPAKVRWHLADGDACSVLIRAAGDPLSADLLIVGSRGQSAHAGLLLGSVSLQLAEHATVPLIIVPSGRSLDDCQASRDEATSTRG